jgi:flagellar protein FlaG
MEIFKLSVNEQSISQSKAEDNSKRVVAIGQDMNVTNKSESLQFNEKDVDKKVQKIIEELNQEMETLHTTIRFGFNDEIDQMYVTVIDTRNNEVIRQIPSEQAMKLAEKMKELVGMLFDEKY